MKFRLLKRCKSVEYTDICYCMYTRLSVGGGISTNELFKSVFIYLLYISQSCLQIYPNSTHFHLSYIGLPKSWIML